MRSGTHRPVSLGGGQRVGGLPPGAADATRERLRQALREGEVLVESGTRRLADPFDALRNRQSLDRNDQAHNALLWQAGERLRRHWHGGHLGGLTAFDFTRESVDAGGGSQATPPSEAALRHRDQYRKAEIVVGARLMPYLTGMVIDAQPATALCHLVTDTNHRRTAEALVVDRLREALHRLVEHWGLGGRRPRG